MKIEILDSTLRDGAQSEKISYSLEDKLEIAKLLLSLGITYVEAGAPFSNPRDVEFYTRAPSLKGLVSFTCTRRKDETAQDSAALRAALESKTQTITLFGKASAKHVTEILGANLGENLDMIESSASYLVSKGKKVIFDAEHFFDGYRDNPEYALNALEAAKRGGAKVLVLCDTNGASMPDDVYRCTEITVKNYPDHMIGIHCHDDTGLACANSVMAVKAGARHIQGTFIGTGERCGNANLSSIIANLQLKCGYPILTASNLKRLTDVAWEIAEISNIHLNSNMPYVGQSAFAHKAGMHSDGVLKNAKSFEHVTPESVGNERKLLLSELSGSAVIREKIKKFCPNLTKDSEEIRMVLSALKNRESLGYQYEGAEASFKLLVKRTLHTYSPAFELVSYKCINEFPAPEGVSATATVKIRAKGESKMEVAEGDGPVHALDKALRQCLESFYPFVKNIILSDYKVRVLTPKDATAAMVRVLITSSDGKTTWTTVGVSSDIIEASWLALVDSFEYKILKD